MTVEVVDSGGNPCPRADVSIKFDLDGPGEIAALGNGDPTSVESFAARERKAFNGKCMVVVRTRKGEGGPMRLSAESEGLKGAAVEIRSE